MDAVKENAGFVGVCLVAVVGLVLVAYLFERAARARSGGTERILATRKIVMIGMFSAISGILYCFDFSIPVIAPEFYKLDFSELPAMIAGFAFGPCRGCPRGIYQGAGQARDQGYIDCFRRRSCQLPDRMHAGPAGLHCLSVQKSRKTAIAGCVVGTVVMTRLSVHGLMLFTCCRLSQSCSACRWILFSAWAAPSIPK